MPQKRAAGGKIPPTEVSSPHLDGKNSRPPIRVAVVEDDDLVRRVVAREIERSDDLRCVGSYATGEAALERMGSQCPDVVVMDITLPGMGGIECVRTLKARWPAIEVLMLTVHEDTDLVFQSFKAGASGYLLKTHARQELADAIREVTGGASPITGIIARKVVRHLGQTAPHISELEGFTKREQEVLELLTRGAAYKEIAESLHLSIETIRMYVKSVYTKLHVHSRGEAVAKFIRK